MIDLSEKNMAIVRQILTTYVPDLPVWVFGSRIKGTAKPYSDLDLVVVGEEKLPMALYFKILDAFEESDLPIKVDFLDWHRLDPSFQQVIQAQYDVLQ